TRTDPPAPPPLPPGVQMDGDPRGAARISVHLFVLGAEIVLRRASRARERVELRSRPGWPARARPGPARSQEASPPGAPRRHLLRSRSASALSGHATDEVLDEGDDVLHLRDTRE